jgi:hypothetical protein
MRTIFIALSLVFLGVSQAQMRPTTRKGDRLEVQLNYLIDKLAFNLQDMPLNIKRVALFEIKSDINSVYLSKLDLRNNLTQQLINAGLTVVQVPEFEDRITLKVRTTDSSFKIDNRSGVSRLKSDNRKLISVCNDYNVQGLFNCQVYFDSLNGPKLALSLLQPASKSILWMKQVDLRSDVIVNPHHVYLGVGMGLQKIDEIRQASNDSLLTNDLTIIPITVSLSYFQTINANRNSEFGLQFSLRSIEQTPTSYTDANLGTLGRITIPSGGIAYQASFLRKNTILPKYWMNFQLGLNYFYYKKSFLGFHQRLGIRLTESLNFDFKLEQSFNNFPSQSKNGLYNINLDNLNYGAQISFIF